MCIIAFLKGGIEMKFKFVDVIENTIKKYEKQFYCRILF